MKKYIFPIIIILLFFASGLYSCPLYRSIGIPCPACGITRAYRLLFTGHIKAAFLMHPLFWMPPLFLFKPMQKKWLLGAAVTLFSAVYLWRFILLFPHTPPFNFNYNSVIGEFLR